MPVDKFSISLPEELVADVDDLAKADGLTRSGVIREAAEAYVAARQSADYEQRRRERIDDALAGLDVVASQWGADDRSSLDYLREIRGDDDAPGTGGGDAGE